MSQKIDIKKLSKEERLELLKDLEKEQISEKEQLEQNRKAYKDLVNENLSWIVEPLKKVSEQLSEAKLYTFHSLKDLLELKTKAYGIKDNQQSHTFSDDKGNTITYGFRVLDNWDDTVTAGIDKVRDFITSLATDDKTAKLVDAINRLLKKDAKGNLKASRVLELTKLAEEFDNDDFTDAVEIIRKAYKPTRSAFFIEVSYKDAQGKKVTIPLSITSVGFPEGTNIDTLFPVNKQYN